MAGVDASAQLVQAPAFVLHTRPWRETSLLVEVLTARHGRLGLIARGLASARAQPLRAALQPWQWVGLAYVPKGELGQLRGAEPLELSDVNAVLDDLRAGKIEGRVALTP